MLRTIMIGAGALLFTTAVAGAQPIESPDFNNDGRITVDEWQEYWIESGQNDPNPTFSTDDRFTESDLDSDGMLNEEESMAMFSLYDQDGDGVLDQEEINREGTNPEQFSQ